MTQKKHPHHFEISFRVDGKLHTGSYVVEGGIITAYYEDKRKTTQVGGSPAEVIAQLLIGEMIAEG